MTDDMNEKLLQEYLEGRSPVSDAYQSAEKSGPPPELDRAVLAEARAAAWADRDIGSPRWQAWLMPVSLAATVTLCIALVTEVIVFDPLLKTADSPQTFSDTLEAEADAPVAAPATAGRQAREQPPIQQTPQRSADTIEEKQELTRALDEVTSAAVAVMTAEEMPEKATDGQARDNLAAPEPSSDRPPSEKRRAVRFVPSQTGAASAGTIEMTSGEASGRTGDIVATARLRTDSPAWPAADVWLAGIRFLFEQGEQERAEAELDKFREHYPDYPLGELVRGTDED